jgi:hypothetical protein
MKALDDRIEHLQRQGLAADLAARVAALFAQLPLLYGFSVRDRATVAKDGAIPLDGQLWLADVTVLTPPPGLRASHEFAKHVAATLRDLMDEEPDVGDLMCGRTFARTVQ